MSWIKLQCTNINTNVQTFYCPKCKKGTNVIYKRKQTAYNKDSDKYCDRCIPKEIKEKVK